MPSEKLGEAFVQIKVDTSDMDRGLNEAKEKSKQAGEAMRKALAVGIAASVAAVVKGTQILAGELDRVATTSINAFKEAEAVNSRFKNVLGESADEGERFVAAFSQETGLGQITKRDQISRLFAFANAMGASRQEALELAKNMSVMATDFRSFYDLASDEESFRKIFGGLSGEAEPLKRLGIVIKEEEVNRRALSEGIVENAKDLTNWQRVAIRAQMITEQGKQAVGDYMLTYDEYGNALERLTQQQMERHAQQGERLKDIVLANKMAVMEWTASWEEAIINMQTADDLMGDLARSAMFYEELKKAIPAVEELESAFGAIASKLVDLGILMLVFGKGSTVIAGMKAMLPLVISLTKAFTALGAAMYIAHGFDQADYDKRLAEQRKSKSEELNEVLRKRTSLQRLVPEHEFAPLASYGLTGIHKFHAMNESQQSQMLDELRKGNELAVQLLEKIGMQE